MKILEDEYKSVFVKKEEPYGAPKPTATPTALEKKYRDVLGKI
jgi:hypothetical protein